MEEIWKPVVGYEGFYEVSNLGRVRSLDRVTMKPHPRNGVMTRYIKPGRIMKPASHPNGYLTICLKVNGSKENCLVHRLVGKAFVPGFFEGADINHKNEMRTDNSAENLEWCTRSYNLKYNERAKHVGIIQGKPVEQLSLDGELIATYYTIRQAESATGVNHNNISKCCRHLYGYKTAGGYRWKYKK